MTSLAIAPINPSPKPMLDPLLLNDTNVNNDDMNNTNAGNERTNSDSHKFNTASPNSSPSLKALQSLAAQSSSSRNVLSRLPACRTFPKLLKLRGGRKWKFNKPSQIEGTHAHDVLCGRGNHVNCHPGNEYYRSLVKQHLAEYALTPKTDKPRIAGIIYTQIRLRDPPGRFLKQDPESKLWHEIGEQKAISKTRQALREIRDGNQVCHQVTKRGINESHHDRRFSLDSSNSTASKERTPSPPSHGPSNPIAPRVIKTDDEPQDYSLLHEYMSTAASVVEELSAEDILNNSAASERTTEDGVALDESPVNSAASSLVDSKRTTSSNCPVVNSVPNGSCTRISNVSPETTNDAIAVRSDHSLTDVVNTRTTMATTDESIINEINSRVNQCNRSFPDDYRMNTVTSRISELTKKRSGTHDTTKEINKRPKVYTPDVTFSSSAKDSVGAAALLAMSYGGDTDRIGDVSFGSRSTAANGQTDKLASHSRNQMWTEGNVMPCDTCLGTGSLPIPNSALISAQSTGSSTRQDSIIANFKLMTSSESQSRKRSAQVPNPQQVRVPSEINPNTSPESSSSWLQKNSRG